MNEQAVIAPQKDFAEALTAAAAQAPPEGERLHIFLDRLDGRAHGVLALVLGLVLLIPVRWVTPQIAGLLLLASGWRLFAGQSAPLLPLLGAGIVTKPRLQQIGAMATKQTWLKLASRPRLDDLASSFALKAAALALILAGLAALLPTSHFLLGAGLIVLGLGLAQKDGAAILAGIAVCLGASAFVLTLAAGVVAGAPFAVSWGETNLPGATALLHPPQAPLVPEDHETR